mmetsp:Transcript_20736/g.43674  ORF Transcript_20736/g.43674 Transcript_20736/m.43674 type:complete len:318 (-) Transcript_20736:435-1388(-)
MLPRHQYASPVTEQSNTAVFNHDTFTLPPECNSTTCCFPYYFCIYRMHFCNYIVRDGALQCVPHITPPTVWTMFYNISRISILPVLTNGAILLTESSILYGHGTNKNTKHKAQCSHQNLTWYVTSAKRERDTKSEFPCNPTKSTLTNDGTSKQLLLFRTKCPLKRPSLQPRRPCLHHPQPLANFHHIFLQRHIRQGVKIGKIHLLHGRGGSSKMQRLLKNVGSVVHLFKFLISHRLELLVISLGSGPAGLLFGESVLGPYRPREVHLTRVEDEIIPSRGLVEGKADDHKSGGGIVAPDHLPRPIAEFHRLQSFHVDE